MKNESTKLADYAGFRISVIGRLSAALTTRLASIQISEIVDPDGDTISILSSRIQGKNTMTTTLRALRAERFPLLGVERLHRCESNLN